MVAWIVGFVGAVSLVMIEGCAVNEIAPAELSLARDACNRNSFVWPNA